MAGKIFVNYRRDDAKAEAARLHDRLAQSFGAAGVFMDVDNLRPGERFDLRLKEALAGTDVFLAVIGARWLALLEARAASGERDYVREEIAAALAAKLVVIPVLMDRAPLPKAASLPEDIRELALYHKHDVVYESFGRDVQALIRAIEGHRREPDRKTAKQAERRAASGVLPWKPAAAGAVAIAAAIALFIAQPWRRVQVPLPALAERIEIDAAIVNNPHGRWFLPGAGKTESFRDCADCPEMVVVSAGSFLMGSSESEPEREGEGKESPQHEVTIRQPFAVGRTSVTRDQFAEFVKAKGYKTDGVCWNFAKAAFDKDTSWRSPGFDQTGDHPAVCVNWNDAKAYVAWLSEKTGKVYRLPSEAEREYVTRAGTATPFWWGETITTAQANYNGNGAYNGGPKGEYRAKTVPVLSFAPNAWGLYQVHGNVWEWVEDCWSNSYEGAPAIGSPWRDGECTGRALRGGSWDSNAGNVRAASRLGRARGDRGHSVGFRCARVLP